NLAVIAVFVKGGVQNPILQKIINNIPKDQGKEHMISGEPINPGSLIPLKKDYYSFDGSLTIPPCSEGVKWIVMANTISAAPPQIMELRKAAGGPSARPVQPLNGRQVFYSGT